MPNQDSASGLLPGFHIESGMTDKIRVIACTMILKQIHLTNFRNFEKNDFRFSPYLTLIVGENARGKTSLLEAVFTSVYGTGFRETREIELIRWDVDDNLVESLYEERDQDAFFQVRMQKSSDTTVRKTYYVNKTGKSSHQYRSMQTQAVLFAPEQIQIITGSPSRRRRYFDEVISAVDLDYKKKIRYYENALRKRNKILEHYEDELKLFEELKFWDNYLIEHGEYISKKRASYIEYLNTHPSVNGKNFSITYEQNLFSPDRLNEVKKREYRLRRTLIGPQKDDFVFSLQSPQKKNVGLYGSRSEQRMAIFWLKLNELSFFEEHSEVKPLLLLDDIFSELDEHNRELVMGMIKEHQTIATTTEVEIKDIAEMPEELIRL